MPKLPKTIYATVDLLSDGLLGLLAWREVFDAAADEE